MPSQWLQRVPSPQTLGDTMVGWDAPWMKGALGCRVGGVGRGVPVRRADADSLMLLFPNPEPLPHTPRPNP